MGRVRKLPISVIRQIAAGEVIERPASAVKELLDNAIDANASRIDVEILSGGKEYIKVVDDGIGISSDDAPLVFEKHTTSKIASEEDLHSITYLGFRGEALHSIAVASRKVILTTRYRDEGIGSRVVVEGGAVSSISPIARTVGTTVEIHDLFFSLPARRKFLKSISYETRKVKEVLMRYIFAYPEIRFSLKADGKTLISYTSSDLQTFYYITVKRKPTRIDILSAEEGEGKALMWLFFDTVNYQPFFYITINGRPILSGNIYGIVRGMLKEHFGGEIPPSVSLWLWLPPHLVDPNIHPAKLEVDIKDSSLVRRLLSHMLNSRENKSISYEDIGGKERNTENLSDEMSSSLPKSDRESPRGAVIKLFTPSEEEKAINRGEETSFPQIIDVVDKTFVIYRYRGEIKVADQHALMEGILFGLFWKKKGDYIQHLSVPWHYEVRDPDAMKEKLERLGFEVSILSENSIAIRGIPSILTLRIWNRDLMGLLISDVESGSLSKNKIADVACKISIKAGDSASTQFLQALIKLGEEYPEYAYDPHGRPAMITLSGDILAKLFKRK